MQQLLIVFSGIILKKPWQIYTGGRLLPLSYNYIHTMYMYNDYTYSLMSDGPCISSLQNPPMTPTSVPVTTCRYLINFY